MSGGFGDDTQSGGPGDDTIFANRGRDTTSGGPGNDHLWALARARRRRPERHARRHAARRRRRRRHPHARRRAGRRQLRRRNDRAILDFKDVIEDATAANPKGSCELVERRPARRKDSRSEDRTAGSHRKTTRALVAGYAPAAGAKEGARQLITPAAVQPSTIAPSTTR